MKRKSIVIVSKIRFSLFLSIILLVLTLLINGLLNGVIAREDTYSDYLNVFIREGDSIWNIAQDNNPYNEDIRKIVYKIEKFNNLKGKYIQPGDVIKVPKK